MTCPTCQFDNEEGAETCKACGQVLAGDGGELKLGSLVAERYEVKELLGRGGMGVVYKAHDRLLEETVALKVLRAEALSRDLARRFREEIKLARKVTHRNVCRIHDYGEVEGLRYISMAFVDGIDLKRVLRKQGPLPTQEALAVAQATADGLQAIHDEGIVHRDLKTANIMRDQKGVVRLMDFGIAKSSEGSSGMTATGVIVGTPDYMSPEQATGVGLDARSDLYSMGVVIYELFTGRVPFHADTPMATLLRHIQEPLRLDVGAATRIPAVVRPVLERAMAKAPADRYASARELGDALRRVAAVAKADVPEGGTATISAGALALAPTPAPSARTQAEAPPTRAMTVTRAGPLVTPQPQPTEPAPRTVPGIQPWVAIALPAAGLIGVGLVIAIVYLARTIAEDKSKGPGGTVPTSLAAPSPSSTAPMLTPASTTLPAERPTERKLIAAAEPVRPSPQVPATTLPRTSATAAATAMRPPDHAAVAAAPATAPPTPTAAVEPAATAWAAVVKVADDASRPAPERLAAVTKFINENPPNDPHRADADRLFGKINDEITRKRLLLPPDPSAPGRQRKATYVGGTQADIADGTEGLLAFERERTLFVVGAKYVVVPNRTVSGIDYGLTDHLRGLVFKKKSHYMSVTYKDPNGENQGLVLELGSDDFRPILTQLEARTGTKVKYQDEKAAKERWR